MSAQDIWGLESALHFCVSPSSLGEVKGLLGKLPRCDHAYTVDRVQKFYTGQRSQGPVQNLQDQARVQPHVVPWWVSIAHTLYNYTAGWLGLDVLGSSLQLSYIKRAMADIKMICIIIYCTVYDCIYYIALYMTVYIILHCIRTYNYTFWWCCPQLSFVLWTPFTSEVKTPLDSCQIHGHYALCMWFPYL